MKKMMMLTTTAYMSERFNRSNILLLEEMGYEVHVVANFDKGNPTTAEVLNEFKNWIKKHHGKYFSISVTKYPTDLKNNGNAYRQLKELIKEHQYEFIHCHTPVAGVLGRLAGHCTKTKVIYTAHGFHFFKGAPLKNWLLYYPVEHFLSRWTDMLITINKEDYERAKRSFHAKRTEYIPGVGIDTQKFSNGLIDREEKRKSLGLEETDIMLLSVGELSPRKNHGIVIEAIAQLKEERYKYFICGKGSLIEKYQSMIRELGLEKQVFLLGYRNDISELCQAADLYIFPSYQEGLPVALMEAVACHVPVICTNVRGNTDLIKNPECLFSPEDREGLIRCMQKAVKKSPSEQENGIGISEEFRQMAEGNYERLANYDLESVMEQIKNLYRNETDISAWGGVRRMYYRQQLRKELGIPMDAKVLLSVGELNENKNHSVVIEALKILKEESIHYVIVGQGILREELEKLAEKLDLKKRVHILGYRDDVPQIYQAVDIFVFPSKREGLSVALMEAMASGLPVVCSNVRGNTDLMEEGKGGYLVNADSVAEFAEKIEKLGNSDGIRTEWGIYNRCQTQKYDVRVIRTLMECVYEVILK